MKDIDEDLKRDDESDAKNGDSNED
jgi:hypothetical protein